MLPNAMHEFADETFIFGLHLLRRNGLSVAETTFWMFTVAVLTCLTVKDLANLTREWFSEEPTTLAYRDDNESIIFSPAPTMFVPVKVDRFILNVTDPKILEPKTERILAAYNQSVKEENFTIFIDSFDDVMAELVFAMLVSVNELEYRLTRGRLNELNESRLRAWAHLYNERPNFRTLNRAMRDLFRRMQDANVSFRRLIEVAGAWYCRKFELRTCFLRYDRFSERTDKTCSSACGLDSIVHLDNEGVDVKLTAGDLEFTSLTDQFVILAKDAVSNKSIGPRNLLWLDFGGGPGTEFEKHADMGVFLLPAQIEELNVRVSTVFQRHDRASQPCSYDERWSDCTEVCTARFVLKRCGCWPTYQFPAYVPPDSRIRLCPNGNESIVDGLYMVPFAPGCLLETDKDVKAVKKSIENCKEACKPDCTTRTYVFNEVVHAAEPIKGYNVAISIRSLSFPVFKEHITVTFQMFLSQLGGVLGLWLGVSFAAILHIPVFLIRRCAQRLKHREEQGAPKTKTVHTCVVAPMRANEVVVEDPDKQMIWRF